MGDDLDYGNYFESIRRFLVDDGGRVLADAVGRQLGTTVRLSEFRSVEIQLEKHGEYYHPARVRSRYKDTECSLVVNLAASEKGKRILRQDFENLQRLGACDPWGFLPRFYHLAPGKAPGSPAMALGQWLAGFEEFHLSAKPEPGRYLPVVWAPDGPRHLTPSQNDAIYRGAAALLTAFYNPLTFEQIGQWHHAAGDFVVNVDTDPLAVRLITVRRYAPLLDGVRVTTATVLHGLLLFLVNLTIRMRFDRLDGTGAMVLADTRAVLPVVEGFVHGLSLRETAGEGPEDLAEGFFQYLKQSSESDLSELVTTVIGRLHPRTAGRSQLRRQRAAHAAALAAAVVRCRRS